MSYLEKIQTFETLFATWISKLQRVEELRAQGRYGYQLRMPKKAVGKAYRNLSQWCAENNEECPV